MQENAPKSKNSSSKSCRAIMNERAKLVVAGNGVPFHVNKKLRDAVTVLKSVERKFARLYREAEKRVDCVVAAHPGTEEEKAQLKEAMLDKAVTVSQARLIKKAERMQAIIDSFKQKPAAKVVPDIDSATVVDVTGTVDVSSGGTSHPSMEVSK